MVRWSAHCLSVLALILLLAGCRSTGFLLANAPAALGSVDRHYDLSYGDDRRQRLDVYGPRGATGVPVVIFWYGGSWTSGSKAHYRFVGTTLAQEGFVAVVPDYRLYPKVKFPLFDEDGARAIAWVQQHAEEFGGDSHRIVLMGHSAGGHTAAFLAFNHTFLRQFGANPDWIRGLVGLSGTYELVPDSDDLRAAFTSPYTEQDWQPIQFVDARAPPTLLLHGLDDKEVLPQESIDLRDALLRSGVRVELILYPHRGHGATVAPFAKLARWQAPVVDQTEKFISSVTTAPPSGSVSP